MISNSNFRVGRKHARYRFARRTEFFMQGAGSKEDTHLRREDLIVSWRQLCVESFGRCQYAGNWIFSAASELSLPFSLRPRSPKQQFAKPIQKHRSCMCCPQNEVKLLVENACLTHGIEKRTMVEANGFRSATSWPYTRRSMDFRIL